MCPSIWRRSLRACVRLWVALFSGDVADCSMDATVAAARSLKRSQRFVNERVLTSIEYIAS